jgi:peptide/nickel transport system ATP-binding protein
MEDYVLSQPIIESRNVTKTYWVSSGFFRGKQSLRAVAGVSLKIQKGSVLGLVGESGCGKSTMADLLLGLQEPTSGEIHIDGRSLNLLSRQEIARRIQPVFQDPYSSLNPRKSIASIISLPLRVFSRDLLKEQETQVDGIMEMVGLAPRLKHNYPSQLSGGQRQRVAIARALITRPDVVICDEPTSALDVSVQAQILNLLLDLHQNLGLTYILISHDLAVVEHLAGRVAVMYLGRIVEEAATRDLFKHPRHPYTQALLTSVLVPNPRLGLPETHLGITYPDPTNPPSGCTFHPRCPKVDDVCRTTAPSSAIETEFLVECHFPN